KKQHIVARVRRPDGLVLDFRLPKDITHAIKVSPQTDWFERLRGGLIVAPMAPYVGKGKTAFFIGRIERVIESKIKPPHCPKKNTSVLVAIFHP
ncbi:hypothetical protein FU656_10590, partial [Lacticaseibacillus rhamnosus]